MVKCENCGGPHRGGSHCFYCGAVIYRKIEVSKLERTRAALRSMRERSEEAIAQSVFAKPEVTH